MDLHTTLTQCRHGDPEAFARLFDYFEDDVYDLACVILRDPHDAQDVVQETFIRVLERLDSYRGEAAFQTWLTAIAVNCCRDLLRSPFILFYRYEMKCEEIAAVLGLATTTIYDRLSQARRRLRLILDKEPAVAPVPKKATESKRC
jgi:DNA-directed RNA polymerase specialized sigma24 family protein